MTEFPTTQHAIQFVGPDTLVHNPAKEMDALGPTQVLVKTEACGICFSDTKLLHAWTSHPRKGPVLSGMSDADLASIPSYRPGAQPGVPGHEPVGRIVAVGDAVTNLAVGQRVLIQTDYRHLPTNGSNAAFGYNFEGALQEYVVIDERVATDPATGESFLIPVSETPSASAVALIEPWACVEAAYAWAERQHLKPGGRLLVLGAPDAGLATSLVGRPDVTVAESLEGVDGSFDDIVYYGSDADVVEALGPRLLPGGVLNIVLGGGRIDRPVQVDVGRVHYDGIRYCGTSGDVASEGWARIPATCELEAGESVAIIGAAGPMGLMHTVRTAVSGIEGLSMDAIDVDDVRLAHLARVVAPIAEANGVPTRFLNSRDTALEPGYQYVAVMVPAPALVAQAVALASEGGVVNAFAGFGKGTLAPLDVDAMVRKGIYIVGTSGSRIEDMVAVLAKVESGTLDTNISMDAITGMAGVQDAIDSVVNRTSGGKIMVYPMLPDLGLVRLADLPSVMPEVAAQLVDGLWTRAAEEALLASKQG
ncbi:MAG TPA: alcohol dehydrogenase catalytic domain-containing protein [Propionibacteriaceae bacterium]|nr:alcohol dehydrogenase catalytic domain-containing protein [Propionibacteriaceae bacterium]